MQKIALGGVGYGWHGWPCLLLRLALLLLLLETGLVGVRNFDGNKSVGLCASQREEPAVKCLHTEARFLIFGLTL